MLFDAYAYELHHNCEWRIRAGPQQLMAVERGDLMDRVVRQR